MMREKLTKRDQKLKEIMFDSSSIQYNDSFDKFQQELMGPPEKRSEKKKVYNTDREIVNKIPLPKSVHTSRPPIQDLKKYQNKIQSFLKNREFVIKMKIFMKIKS
jgi:hypothetical protein